MYRIFFSIALWAAVTVMVISCSGDDGNGGYARPRIVPDISFTVDTPLKRSSHQVIVHNPDASDPVKLTSLRILDDINKPLEELEIDGVRHYRLNATDAEYYFRMELATRYLIIKDAASLDDSATAASMVSSQGDDLCNSGDLPVELAAPNWCDMLAGTSVLETSVMKLNGSYTLPTASQATLVPLLHPADSSYQGYAAGNGIELCDGTALTTDNIMHVDPYDGEDIWETVDGQKVLDNEKLLAFCEKRPGSWNESKLSISASSMRMSDLPLNIITWAVPNSDVAQVPARSFFLAADYEGGENPVKLTIRFNSAVAGNPVAEMLTPTENAYALEAVQLDGRTSMSPLGAQREPLEYYWSAEPVDQDKGLPALLLPPDGDPASGDPLNDTWTDQGIVEAWLPLVGEYIVSLKVRDSAKLESEVVTHHITAGPQGRLYAQLAWDNEDADMELFFVRYRATLGTCMVPPADDDIFNPPNGVSCTGSIQCAFEGKQYFCSTLSDNSNKCTYHSDAAHSDTCFAENPNPNWGDPQSPDDNPRLVANWRAPGPVSMEVDRPVAGLYRLVVQLLPSSPRSIDKDNPVTARLTVFAGGQVTEFEQPLYFRPPSEDIPDIPIWKVADIDWPDSGTPTVTAVPVQGVDCYNPGLSECTYANPGNSVVEYPYDPQDPNRPRSIWCDARDDLECVL